MGDASQEPSPTHLLSHYGTKRVTNGKLLVQAAPATGPVLGCAIPTAVVTVAGGLIALLFNAPAWWGPPVLTLLFAAVFIPVFLYRGSRAWLLGRGSIQEATAVGTKYWSASSPLAARSVVLKREVWRDKRGSTDRVQVATDRASRLNVLSVYNWAGQESRLAHGGAGSLARAGQTVPDAPGPLAVVEDPTLLSSASEAVRELVYLLIGELDVAITYECVVALYRPRR
jgi:hypothetical protein